MCTEVKVWRCVLSEQVEFMMARGCTHFHHLPSPVTVPLVMSQSPEYEVCRCTLSEGEVYKWGSESSGGGGV